MTNREKILIAIAKMEGRTCLVIHAPTIPCHQGMCNVCPYNGGMKVVIK
jgi:hypothetical protein